MLESTDRRSRQPRGPLALLAVLLVGAWSTGCKAPQGVSEAPSVRSSAPDAPGPVDGATPTLAGATDPGLDPDILLLDEIQRIQGEVLAGRSTDDPGSTEGTPGRLPDLEQTGGVEPIPAMPALQAAAWNPSREEPASATPVGTPDETARSGAAVELASPPGTAAAPSGEQKLPAVLDPTLGTMDDQARYVRSLLRSASLSDTPLRHHLTLAIVLAMTGPDQAFEPEGLAELTDEEQELVRIVHDQFKSLGSELDDGADSDAVLRHLQALTDLIRTEDTFRINRLALCTRVRDFGVIDVVEPPVFDPNERSSFIWYLELDGFKPDHDPQKGTWAYEFDLKLEMLTRDTGVPVIAPLQSTVRHDAGSEVRDFYLRDLFNIPRTLQFDWYTTKLTVIDRKSGAQAQQSADFLWVPNLEAGVAHMQRQAVVPTSE